MYILSIYMSHDSAVCVLKDGKVLLNLQLERFSRIKYDYGYREDFLQFCLTHLGLTIQDIDFVCAKSDLREDLKLRKGTILSPCRIPKISRGQWFLEYDMTLLGKKFRALNVEHHLAHAASTFFTSPFKKSSIYTFDGGGDCSNGFSGYGQGNKIVRKKSLYLGETMNVAEWWSNLCFNNYKMKRIHELDPGPAGRLMALAAYGKAQEKLKRDIKIAINNRSPKSLYRGEDLSNTRSERSQNIASSMQAVSNEFLFSSLEEIYQQDTSPNVCYAGGFALNCIANSKVMQKSSFTNLHIPPCPNDSGLALGMALFAYYHFLDNPRIDRSYFSPYTGPIYGIDNILSAVKNYGYEYKKTCSEEVAGLLAEKNIICFYIGRSECGPRALGHRSIIAHPGIEGLREFLNEKVKLREWYRPFAPIVLSKYADDIFEVAPGDSPYMSKSGVIKKEWRKRLSGILHIDNSTRPQIIERKHEPYIYGIIDIFREKTGIPVVLNTSFNCHEPIVESPEDALKTFSKIPIRYLLMNDFLIIK